METDILSIDGRVTRSIYWTRAFIVFVLNIVLILILSALINNSSGTGFYLLTILVFIFSSIFMLMQLIKRMHDINKSGFYILIPVYNLILSLIDGTADKNKFGADPKGRMICKKCNIVNNSNLLTCTHCGTSIYPLIFTDGLGTSHRAKIYEDIQNDLTLYNGTYTHLLKGGLDSYEFICDNQVLLLDKFRDFAGRECPKVACKKVKVVGNILKSNRFSGRFVKIIYENDANNSPIKGLLSHYNFYEKQT